MRDLRIEYEDNQYIDVQIEDYLFFLGGHNKWKRKIVRSLKRFSLSKSLNELESVIYGDDGIGIALDNKELKIRQIKMLVLEDNSSIYNELSYSKGNLMYEELQSWQDNLVIAHQMEYLNDELIKLEVILNQEMKRFSDSVSSEMIPIIFSDILKNHLKLMYQSNRKNYPLEMMNSSELLDEYLTLIRHFIKREEKPVWLVIVNPESFLEAKDLVYLFESLKKIAAESKQLKCLIFSNQSLPLNYTIDDVGKTVLLYDDYQQMPIFDNFKESIERHYPDELILSDQELVESFFRINHLIGLGNQKNRYLKSKDIVLLKVISKLLNVDFSIETSVDSLTNLEEAFLNDD